MWPSRLDYITLDLPAAPNQIDIQNSKEVLNNYNVLRRLVIQKMNDVEYIMLRTDQFKNPDPSKLKQWDNDLRNTLNKLTHAASACVNDIQHCTFGKIDLPVADLLPERKDGSPGVIKSPSFVHNVAVNNLIAKTLAPFAGHQLVVKPIKQL